MKTFVEKEQVLEILSSRNAAWDGYIRVKELPNADVRPVVHGEWENAGSDVWKCSRCGYGIMPWNAGVNYCPNCGADMKEEYI